MPSSEADPTNSAASSAHASSSSMHESSVGESSTGESSASESCVGESSSLPEVSSPSGSPEERPRAVHVRFAASEGRRLERPEPTTCGQGRPLWAERPLLLRRARGTYELIGTSQNLEGLARWVLSFGTRAKVQGPERLQRQVALQARRVWQKYGEK